VLTLDSTIDDPVELYIGDRLIAAASCGDLRRSPRLTSGRPGLAPDLTVRRLLA
jgi:hypothetical protein